MPDSKTNDVVMFARDVVRVIREQMGFAAIIVMVEMTAEGIEGKPVYVSELPRDAGADLLQHVINSVRASDVTDVNVEKEIVN